VVLEAAARAGQHQESRPGIMIRDQLSGFAIGVQDGIGASTPIADPYTLEPAFSAASSARLRPSPQR
jgi:hypothetical protein